MFYLSVLNNRVLDSVAVMVSVRKMAIANVREDGLPVTAPSQPVLYHALMVHATKRQDAAFVCMGLGVCWGCGDSGLETCNAEDLWTKLMVFYCFHTILSFHVQ